MRRNEAETQRELTMNTYTYEIDGWYIIIKKNGDVWKKNFCGEKKASARRWAERTIAAQIDMEANPNPEYF